MPGIDHKPQKQGRVDMQTKRNARLALQASGLRTGGEAYAFIKPSGSYLSIRDLCRICSCSALPAGTIGKTCSFVSTTHSSSTGRLLSYSRNSFIFSGSSAALFTRIACTPIARASATKSGFVMRVCAYRAS